MGTENNILVTGAGGFLGKDLIKHLLSSGWNIRAMVRRSVYMPLLGNKKLKVVYGDMRDQKSLKAALRCVSVVVHLAACKADEKDSEDVNVEGARKLVLACREEGCKRIINVSTQSVKIKKKGIYAYTKKDAEKIFHNSGLQVTSLRPSIVYGEELHGVFGTVLNFVQKLPIVPVLGDGKWLSAPIYIGDVSKAIIACIENKSTIGKIYDLGGPGQINFDNFIERICQELDIKRAKIHIPFGISMAIAWILSKITSRPPITISNVLGSNQNTNIDINPAIRDFGFNPLPFKKGLKAVLYSILKQKATRSPVKANFYKTDFDQRLKNESVLIAKYLIGSHLPKELSDRYVSANQELMKNFVPENTYAELDFILRHDWTLPFIDAAAGLLLPNSIVRKKVLLMAAILETSPFYASQFFQKPDSALKILIICAWNGFRSIFKLIIGIPILIVARREFNGKPQ